MPIELADCSPVFSGCTATDATGVASMAASGLANSIGITLTFDLSPGDSAGITSRSEIIPEPGTAMLLGLGLLGMGLARRR